MARNKVWRYTTAQRQNILDTAKREKLSGAQIAKRFGISMWTYYSWRSPARDIHVKKKRNGKASRQKRSSVRAIKEITVARKRGRGVRYSATEKKRILEAARKGSLTATQVQKQYGVSPLTFYRWRGPVRRRRGNVGRPRGSASLDVIRASVRAQVQRVLPQVIREQVREYLAEILGTRGPGRPRKQGHSSAQMLQY